jgi:hypothetical protein
MKYLMTLMVACLVVPVMLTGQVKPGSDSTFNIYIFPAFYSKKVSDYLLQNNGSVAHLLTYIGIDPDKDQQVDEDAIRKATEKFYPDKDATGLFIIDWEAQPFKDLREYDADDTRFKVAEAKYLQVVNTLKKFRPRLNVGIYGIPFRTQTAAQQKKSGPKLDNLLSRCDVITPSLYIINTDEEVGLQRNMDYLKQNVNQAMDFGYRLKKPVAPFVWYKVHPGNKKFGMSIISKGQMQSYLNFLSSYNYRGSRLNGIIWWEGGERIDKTSATNRGLGDSAARTGASQSEMARDSIILNYTAPFIRKKM